MTVTITKSTYTGESKYVTEDVTLGEGATLKTWTGTVQVMSDIWEATTFACYWDEAEGRVKTVEWVKTATVDATPEVLEKVKEYLYQKELRWAINEAQKEATRIGKDSLVKVVKGRQGKGTIGKVVVTMERPYQMGWRSSVATKVGIATSDEKVKVAGRNGKVYENYKDVTWAWAMNCELVEVPEIDLKEAQERARNASVWKFKDLYRAA
jgi:hypothetical protein